MLSVVNIKNRHTELEIVITDENGKVVPNGERGIIHVKTPSMFSGYVRGSEKHTSLYHGWLNTGDIGFWDKFGELHVVGRVDDVIIWMLTRSIRVT